MSQANKERDPALSAKAAEWLVRLDADDPQERAAAQEEYAAWKQASPENNVAARRLEGLLERMQRLRQAPTARPARTAVEAALREKKRNGTVPLGALLGLLLLLILPLITVWSEWSPGYLLADLKTGPGQWQTDRLEDGSQLALASRSAVNLRYSKQRREVVLVAGRIWVDVAPDPTRPFLVTTPEGSIQALGTRFTVDREAGATVLTMLESRVWVRPASTLTGNGAGLVVSAGQRLRFTGTGPETVQEVDAAGADSAWRNHQLVVQDVPLGQVLATLSHNRRGHLDYAAAELADLRVTAVLPLDDTDKALQLLQLLFPSLEVKHYTSYWVRVRQQEKIRTPLP